MIFDIDEFKEANEKKRLAYRAPLPMKKQRTTSYRYQRNGEVKQFTREEISDYAKSAVADRWSC